MDNTIIELLIDMANERCKIIEDKSRLELAYILCALDLIEILKDSKI